MSSLYSFQPDRISFVCDKAQALKLLYFPLCATESKGIKSSITPHLSGDIKTDKFHYLTKPCSREDLRADVRNFFIHIEKKGVVSLANSSKDEKVTTEAGLLWHKLTKESLSFGIKMEALNFVPVSGQDVELMRVMVRNTSKKAIEFTPTFCLPIFGRALANKHDHEHVTALLHRIEQKPAGVLVEPTMKFDEEGHKVNSHAYFVYGFAGKGEQPMGSFPTMESFLGEAGDLSNPRAVVENLQPEKLSKENIDGKEASGALRFKKVTLKPRASKEFYFVYGMAEKAADAAGVFKAFDSDDKFDKAFVKNNEFWLGKARAISFQTADADFNSWMHWVTIQPVLRRIFGCSFLPDHDYGKGGKGWRDLWQDLLSLILIEPEHVRPHLINNFAGVRIDGTNATIIGSKPGEFFADRNAITRVWMDHGVWPFSTILLYIHQTGDFDILFEKNTYFRDPQLSRTFEKDSKWNPEYGKSLKDRSGRIYQGTILEHILIQHLVPFFNVGEHNITRLENADWNDGLDMAFHRGESVTFMSFYAGNLLALAELLERLVEEKQIKSVQLLREAKVLLDTLTEFKINYGDVEAKKRVLFENYFRAVQPEVSGEQVDISVEDLVRDLKAKAHWAFEHIRKNEKVTVGRNTWFNGYYDNKGTRVEGSKGKNAWMTLTGQVFPIMSGLASKDEIKQVVASVNHYLKDKNLKGVRLNTDFGLRHYLDLGRAFGFAYGTKENGAFFSHMNVMYAYGLYKQGFAQEGNDVIQSIYRMCLDTEKSKIYPGIPEYFDSQGRGMYHYLTGSASWMVLTELTQAFGLRGQYGDLVLDPKLKRDDFDKKGEARVSCQFAGKELTVIYSNQYQLTAGDYQIKNISMGNSQISFQKLGTGVLLSRKLIESTSGNKLLIKVELGEIVF